MQTPLDANFVVKRETVRTRVKQKAVPVTSSLNQDSPVAKIEPVLLQYTIWKQEVGQPITPAEGLQFANSLFDGKPHQIELKLFQATHGK